MFFLHVVPSVMSACYFLVVVPFDANRHAVSGPDNAGIDIVMAKPNPY